jgi:protein transport protein SEC24
MNYFTLFFLVTYYYFSCLNEIINNFSNTRITETILGPVIQAGIDALKCSDRTGKIFIFSTSMPTLEAPGQLKNREDRKILGTDKEKVFTFLMLGLNIYKLLSLDSSFSCK